jgi:hypothetical protein
MVLGNSTEAMPNLVVTELASRYGFGGLLCSYKEQEHAPPKAYRMI